MHKIAEMATSGTAAKIFMHADSAYEKVNCLMHGIVPNQQPHLDLDEVTEGLEAREAASNECQCKEPRDRGMDSIVRY